MAIKYETPEKSKVTIEDVLKKKISPQERLEKKFQEEILPGLMDAVQSESVQFLLHGRYSKEYKEARRKVRNILSPLIGTKWYIKASSRANAQRLVSYIIFNIERLKKWRGGNPWELLNESALKVLNAGFAKKISKKELEKIEHKLEAGWISFQHNPKINEYVWINVIPNTPTDEVEKKVSLVVFEKLQELRKECQRVSREHKKSLRKNKK